MAGLKKLLKRHGGKKTAASKEDVRSQDGSEMVFGYVIAKDKDLPKLHKAVWNGDAAKVKQLCKKTDINQFDKENRTPLHFACSCGNAEITQFLLTNKAKTNLCDNDGRTALMKAIECSHHGCIKILLQNNVDVNVKDKNSSSPLHLTAANNLIDVANLLLEKGININVSDKEGFTSLHVASSLGNQDFVLFLLNKGANVDSADAHGRTSLMTAAADGHLDIVKMLLQNNAEVGFKDSEGWKAADHAVINGNHSCAKIMDEHEKQEAQEKEQKTEEVANKKKPDINEVLRASSPVNGDTGFSFGGPAADKNGVDGNLKSEGSTSRHSDGDGSWMSSSEDEKSEVNKKASKISLVAALKKVERSTSNISNKSQSRIPVRSQSKSPDPAPPQQKVSSPSSQPSKIPRLVTSKSPTNEDMPSPDVTRSKSPPGNSATSKQLALSPTASVKYGGSNSGRSSPATVVGASSQARSRVASPTESVRSTSSDMHGRVGRRESVGSLPLEYLKPAKEDADSEQGSKNNGGKPLGYSPSFMSPVSDRSSRNFADELGLSLSSSEAEEDESVMSGEVVLENSDQKANKDGQKDEIPRSTTKPKEGQQTEETKNPAAYLGLDLDSSISSVSDPDISGMSNYNEERRTKKNPSSVVKKEPKDHELNEETESNWDSSTEGFLPSDNEDVSGKKLSPKASVKSNHDKELQAAVEKRRENLDKTERQENHVDDGSVEDEDESEVMESEWERERMEEVQRKELERIKQSGVKLKLEGGKKEDIKLKLEMEREKQKEEARRLEWERQEREKELELAESIKKELEEELGIDGEHEGSEEDAESCSERESELKSTVDLGGEEETVEDFEEHGSSKWDSTDIEQTNDGEVTDEEPPDSEATEETPEDNRVREGKFEKQLMLKENEMVNNRMNNNNTKEVILVKEEAYIQERSALARDTVEDRGHENNSGISEDNKGIAVDARRVQKEEDDLLEAYKARQEEMLEQERRMEEELARKEQQRIGELRVELEMRKEEDRRRMDELERQRKEREAALQKEKEEFEKEIRKKEEKEREMQELNLKKKQAEDERRRMGEMERQRKEREAALQKEKEEFEEEMRRKEKKKEREMQELNLKKKQAEDERRRIETEKREKELNEIKTKEDEENKARLQNVSHSTPEPESSVDLDDVATVSPTDSDYVSKTNAEYLLAEKHRGFVDDAGHSAAIELEKVHNRGRLADKSREIKQRRQEAKADLDTVRLQTSKLSEHSGTTISPRRESPSAVARGTMPGEAEMMNASPPRASAINSEWSTSSEDEQPAPVSRTKTPLSSRDGGLGSSLSPGVQSVMRPGLLHSLPLMSSSPTMIETSPVVAQFKDSLRNSKRQLEKMQEKLVLSEATTKQLESHADSLQSKLEEVVHQKSAAEREHFEINEENRVLKHECLRATEDKKIAEALVGTVKDQLGRSDEKLNREIKLRRTLEETGKQLEMDRVNLENALRHMSQEREDLKKVLEREREQCRLKDELYKEQKKQNEEIIMESQKVSQHRAEVLTKLETVDESRKNVEASSETFRKELIYAKSEVGRLNSQLETVTKLSQNEIDSLKRQLTEQTEKSRRLEDSSAKLRSQYDSRLSQLNSDNNELQNKLENEVTAKHRLQSETAVLQSRLESSNKECDEANKTRIEAERQLQSLREELYKSKSSLEKELSSLRENNQLSIIKLNAAENKISSLEAELQTANIMLAERSSQMSMNIRDIDNKRASLTNLETELRTEKEENARLSAKLESALEKTRNLENESTNMRYQLEMTSEKVRKQEENSQETQSKLHSTITEIRTDHEKTKGKMSEKERSLADAHQKYKDELEQNFTKLKFQDDEVRRLHQELAEGARKLSGAEASLEIQVKARKDLEGERDGLRQTLRSYEGQMSAKINENQMINGHASALHNELEHSRRVTDETSQRLATTSYDLENLGKVKAGLEDDLGKVKFDRVKLEATLKEEKAKTNLLLGEIRESNEGRTHLESLLSQIKSSNIELEEKLQVESFDKTQYAREAAEANGLWELELRARSKLGAKIVEAENKLNETKAAMEEEKRKTRKAMESRKVLQGKLDICEKRSEQHQKEVQALKTQIKAYRRSLKENENNEKRIPTIQAEFNKEVAQYEANITSQRNQLRDLNERLRQEGDMRVLAERRGLQQEKELSSAKAQSKEQLRQIQKLEKLNRQIEDDMENLKDDYKENFVEKGQLERTKLDLEAKSRIELNRKLADVNAHLEEQALAREVLDRSRSEQETLKYQEMENTISKLKREVEHYRSSFYELQTHKETMTIEAERFKDMYESETKRKEKLNDLLFKEREKSAESKALLNLERSRSNNFLGNSGVNLSYLEHSPGTIGPPKHESTETKSPGFIYSQPKERLMESVDKELSKSIQRHLDSIPTNGPSDLWASKEVNMTSSPLSSSNTQYMETLKRNYFV